MTTWAKRGINYQINLRSMAAREPRNPFEAMDESAQYDSPLAYLAQQLPALTRLGVTVLHLMPPFAMGVEARKGIGSPYAIRDYYTINSEFGTLDEFSAFVREAHALGFRVIIGMVPNHTSRDHVWITSNPEYYVNTDEGQVAFDLDWSDSAKLDYRQPGLRKAMFEVYDHWLGFLGDDGVDGFRIDMAHFINDRSFWDDTLPVLSEKYAEREPLFMAECYGTENNKDLFRRGMNAAYDDDFYKLLVYFYGLDADHQTIVLPDHEAAQNNHDFASKYAAFQKGGLAAAAAQCLLDYEDDTALAALEPILARYTDNHDEGRGVYRFGDGAVRAMMQLAFLAPHTLPFLYGGQEFGAANRPPIHERIQPCDKGCRMQVGSGVLIREGVEFEGNLFARGQAARQAWFEFYQALITLRKTEVCLTDGDFTLLDVEEEAAPTDQAVCAFARQHAGRTLHCAVNLGPTPRKLGNAALLEGPCLYGGWAAPTLSGFSAVVVER